MPWLINRAIYEILNLQILRGLLLSLNYAAAEVIAGRR